MSMTQSKINTKSLSRIAAIQALYQYQIYQYKNEQDIERLIRNMILFYQNNQSGEDLTINPNNLTHVKLSISHFNSLVKLAINHIEQIDKLISGYLSANWQMKDLSPVLLATLRVGIAELMFFPKTPPKVIINEFTTISNEMLSENETHFVNSILDKIVKEQQYAIIP